MLRATVCWVLMAVVPASVIAADSGAAMLYGKGTVWLNGSALPNSSAIFPGDFIETKPESFATITSAGSNAMILAGSVAKFGQNSISIEHGSVAVSTSSGMSAWTGQIQVAPASTGNTEFSVSDTNGKVEIIARQGQVSVSCGGQTSTLAEGQQTTRDDSEICSREARGGNAAHPIGGGGLLNSRIAMWAGAAAAGILALSALVDDDEPVSPYIP